jgi:hypothetical protein
MVQRPYNGETQMDKFERLRVPRDILALVGKPPLLKGESLEEYLDLLAGIIHDLGVRDRPEYLWAIRYADCSWEIIRLRRMRSLIVDHWGERGRAALVQDRVPGAYTGIDAHLSELYPEGVNAEIVGARAMILADANQQLAYFDKSIERLQKRCDSILQLLEGRREMLRHRERSLSERGQEQAKIQNQADAAPTLLVGSEASSSVQ